MKKAKTGTCVGFVNLPYRLPILDVSAFIDSRRSPRHGVLVQQGKCPVCNRGLVAVQGRRGPLFTCACDCKEGRAA